MLLTYTDRCTLIPPVRHFEARMYTTIRVQCNKDEVLAEVLLRAILWRHRSAKSFDVYDFYHTDYYGLPVESPTGYATVKIRYYSRVSEGRFKVAGTELIDQSIYDARKAGLPLEVYASV